MKTLSHGRWPLTAILPGSNQPCSGNGVYVGPMPTGNGPWNGQYSGWSQSNGQWYDTSGAGWYQDSSGNWYTTRSSGFSGIGTYVGSSPSGNGPWNGQYSGWTQSNGWWYNSAGIGWYQDSSGNWYTKSGTTGSVFGSGEGGTAGTVTSTQCMSSTVGQTNATLSCPSGSVVVSVLAAAYGNNPGSCPSSVNTQSLSCTLNITTLIQQKCQGQNQCSITVQSNILGAPTNNGQQCSTSGSYSTSNTYTMVARYSCGIAGSFSSALNSTSLTFTPPNSVSRLSTLTPFAVASLLAILLGMS